MLKFESHCGHTLSMDHDLNKYKSTLPEDASAQVTNFLANWILILIRKAHLMGATRILHRDLT